MNNARGDEAPEQQVKRRLPRWSAEIEADLAAAVGSERAVYWLKLSTGRSFKRQHPALAFLRGSSCTPEQVQRAAEYMADVQQRMEEPSSSGLQTTSTDDDPNGRPDLLGTDQNAVWVWQKTILDPEYPRERKPKPSAWKTLHAYRSHMNGDGSGAYASTRYVGEEIGVHRNTVQSDLEELRDELVERKGEFVPGPQLLRSVQRTKRADSGYEHQPTLPADPRVEAIARKWREKADAAKARRKK